VNAVKKVSGRMGAHAGMSGAVAGRGGAQSRRAQATAGAAAGGGRFGVAHMVWQVV